MPPRADEDTPPPAEVRLDVWLDVSCLFPTRSQAAAACTGGKVHLNGRAAAAACDRVGKRHETSSHTSRRISAGGGVSSSALGGMEED